MPKGIVGESRVYASRERHRDRPTYIRVIEYGIRIADRAVPRYVKARSDAGNQAHESAHISPRL